MAAYHIQTHEAGLGYIRYYLQKQNGKKGRREGGKEGERWKEASI